MILNVFNQHGLQDNPEKWCSTCCHPRLSKCHAFEQDDVHVVPVVLCEAINAIRLITIYTAIKLQELVLLFNVLYNSNSSLNNQANLAELNHKVKNSFKPKKIVD